MESEREKRRELNRLHRIEGQIRAVARMIERGENNSSIDTQLRAIESAVRALRIARVERKLIELCKRGGFDDSSRENLREEIRSILR